MHTQKQQTMIFSKLALKSAISSTPPPLNSLHVFEGMKFSCQKHHEPWAIRLKTVHVIKIDPRKAPDSSDSFSKLLYCIEGPSLL